MLNKDYILSIIEKKFDTGDIQGAINFIKSLIRDNPKDVSALNLLSVAYSLRGDLSSATRVLKKALRIDPNYPETHYHLGLIYYRQKNYLKAVEEFNKAIENYLPRERSWMSDAYTALGEAFYKLGVIDYAVKAWKKAVQTYPKNKRAKYYLNKIKKSGLKVAKVPILVFDFLRFSGMKIDEYLKQKRKNNFESEKEYKRVLDKIVKVWNSKIVKISDDLSKMDDKEKLNYFKSIKIKF